MTLSSNAVVATQYPLFVFTGRIQKNNVVAGNEIRPKRQSLHSYCLFRLLLLGITRIVSDIYCSTPCHTLFLWPKSSILEHTSPAVVDLCLMMCFRFNLLKSNQKSKQPLEYDSQFVSVILLLHD